VCMQNLMFTHTHTHTWPYSVTHIRISIYIALYGYVEQGSLVEESLSLLTCILNEVQFSLLKNVSTRMKFKIS